MDGQGGRREGEFPKDHASLRKLLLNVDPDHEGLRCDAVIDGWQVAGDKRR